MQKRLVQLFLLLLLSLTSIYVKGQATLWGNAPSYGNQTLSFFRYTDFITQTEEEVGSCTVSANGDFSCNLNIQETTYVFTSLGIYKIFLFVEKNGNYQIALPGYEPKTESERLNPYFREVELHAGIQNVESDDINFLISSFDLAYSEHFDQLLHDAYTGTETISLDSVIQRIENQFKGFNNQYFTDYMEYRMGLLKQLTLMQQSKSISRNYFLNRPILYNNLAYMDLFNLVFDKYFLFHAYTDSTSSGMVLRQPTLSSMKKAMAMNEVLANDTLMELITLKGLYDSFFDDKFSRSVLLSILDTLYRTTTITEHLEIAQSIRSKVTRLLAGFAPTPFELYTADDKLFTLEHFKGKYIYLNFCTTTSYACLQEFTLLERIYEKHKDRLEIVTISADRDIDDLKNLLEQTGYTWTFLHYGNMPDVIKSYDVRAFPTHFLIGPDGLLIHSPAASPRENFEMQLFQLLRSRGEI